MGSVDTQSKPRSGCLQGERPCRETRSSIRFGAGPHIFLKLGEFSHKMELWPCAFQRRVVGTGNAGCSCRVVCLCHHTLHPCKERRGARQRPGNDPQCSVGCTVRVRDSSTCTTLQAAQLERTSLNPCTGEALSALRSLTHSSLFCPRGNGLGERLSKPLTPQAPEGHQWP